MANFICKPVHVYVSKLYYKVTLYVCSYVYQIYIAFSMYVAMCVLCAYVHETPDQTCCN